MEIINMQDMPNKISIEKCRGFMPNDKKYSDAQVESIRDVLYKLAGVVVNKFEELRNFITYTVTLDAKARIINNSK